MSSLVFPRDEVKKWISLVNAGHGLKSIGIAFSDQNCFLSDDARILKKKKNGTDWETI